MSIIYDALKKAGQTANKDTEIKKEAKPKSALRNYLIYGLVAIIGFFLANLAFGFFFKQAGAISAERQRTQKKKLPPALVRKAPTSAPTPMVIIPGNPQKEAEPAKPAPPSLVLSGVFFGDNEASALINNQILREGDTIEGATITRIEMDAVELKFQDMTIKLSMGNK